MMAFICFLLLSVLLVDVGQDGQTKVNEVCSRSRQDTVISEAAAPLDIHAVEASGSMLGSSSLGQQNSKGKEAFQDTITSEVVAPPVIQAVEAIGSTLRCPSPGQQKRKGKEVLSIGDESPAKLKKSEATPPKLRGATVEGKQCHLQRSPPVAPVKETFSINDGSFNLPTRLKSDAEDPPTLRGDTVERKHGLVPLVVPMKVEQSHVKHIAPVKETFSINDGSFNLPTRLKADAEDPPTLRGDTVERKHGLVPLVAPMKVEQSHVKHIAPAATSEKRVSGPDGIHDKLCMIGTTDIVEERVPSQKEDFHLPSSGNMDQNALRTYTPQIRLRSSSPAAECEAVSKRSAIVCEYFAKGWCIKGSKCRFLHKRDQVDYIKGQAEGVVLSNEAVNRPGKGSEDAAGASESFAHDQPKFFMAESDDMLPIPTGGRYSEKEHKERVNDKDSFRVLERDTLYPRLSISSQRSPPSKDGSKVFSGQNDVEVDMFKGSCSSDHLERHGSSVSFGRSTLVDNFTPGPGFMGGGAGAGVTSGSHMNHSLLSYALVEESVAMRRQYTLELHSSPLSEFSVKSSSSFRNAAVLDKSSLKELLDSYKNKRKFTPYNWEPSVPFRPSHFITSFTRSSSGVEYDPLRDSMDQPYIGHGSLPDSSYGRTKGVVHQHAKSVSGQRSEEAPKILHSDSNYKDYSVRDKDARVAEAESAAVSATNAENKNASDEEILGAAASVKDVLKATRSISDGNSLLKNDDSRHKGDTGRQTNDLDEEESRVIKVFRAALIEYVKELMKPVWHEGRLSKDVYKVIVQKAEDKILSTLPSNEVPNTPESTKQFLSSSRPNILKLIQAYVDKYGKF